MAGMFYDEVQVTRSYKDNFPDVLLFSPVYKILQRMAWAAGTRSTFPKVVQLMNNLTHEEKTIKAPINGSD